MAAVGGSMALNALLDQWKIEEEQGEKPTNTLQSIAELLEKEMEVYASLDPDPFDDRPPARSSPDCVLGHLLKTLTKNEDFVNKLISRYIMNSANDFELSCQACRVLLSILSRLEDDLFQGMDGFVTLLIKWTKDAKEPLRSYATGLLGSAMEVQEFVGTYQEENNNLVAVILKRMKHLKDITDSSYPAVEDFRLPLPKPKFLRYSASKAQKRREEELSSAKASGPKGQLTAAAASMEAMDLVDLAEKKGDPLPDGKEGKRNRSDDAMACNGLLAPRPGTSSSCSASTDPPSKLKSTKKYPVIKNSFSMYPLTVGMQQRLLLKYLQNLGEYQEILPIAIEHHVINLIFHYINPRIQKNQYIVFSTLKYLASLLCHKKFVTEFVNQGGVQRLLEIPRPSVAATGVSLCLYYLSYNPDAVERVCLASQALLTDLVKYALWLLECSHDSGRCHATLFFSMTFSFRAILELFDSMDGLRKTFNLLSTLDILRVDEAELLADDEVFSSRQTARHTCLALKRYIEAHVAIHAHNRRRSSARIVGNCLPLPIPAYKSIPISYESTLEHIQLLLEEPKYCLNWSPAIGMTKLSGIQLIVRLILLCSQWKGYNSKNDVIKVALDILMALTVSPKSQLTLCQSVPVAVGETATGIGIILRAAEGELILDGEVQCSALHVICNCICGPTGKDLKYYAKFGLRTAKNDDILSKMWSAVRIHNGIKVLLGLFNVKTPITLADSIRALACKALCGLSRSERIKQILGKLPVFHRGHLQTLMREPILPDNSSEHVKFCRYATELLETVTGKSLSPQSAIMPSYLSKGDVVSQTRIHYPSKELLHLIFDYLKTQGLQDTARVLRREAKLREETPTSGDDLSQSSLVMTPQGYKTPNVRSSQVTPGTPSLYRQDMEEKPDMLRNLTRGNVQPNSDHGYPASLDDIVKQYLREQHAHCKHPVKTCPPFSLLRKHRCPEPKHRNRAPFNITQRTYQRQLRGGHGGLKGQKLNNKFIHSRFRPIGSVVDHDESSYFTCVAFMPAYTEYVLLGTHTGELKMYSVSSGQEEATYSCHQAAISSCEVSKDGQLLITSSPYGLPLGALWSFGESQLFEMKMHFPDDSLVKFSSYQDKVIGTEEAKAHVYDLTTGKLVSTFFDANNMNQYLKNCATFNSTDDLVLNDGCLWDVRAKKFIHKFDKFNNFVSGVFHPSGLEIIINSEVWDIRTFHLLDTCVALDQCRVIFNNAGNVIYGIKHTSAQEEDAFFDSNRIPGPYDSSFRTFDALDYSAIATVDVKKIIFDLAVFHDDGFVAVVENVGHMNSSSPESMCRLYEVGRQRRIDGEDSDEEKEDEDENEDDNGDETFDLEDFLLGDDDNDDDDDDDDDDADDNSSEFFDDDDFDYDDSSFSDSDY